MKVLVSMMALCAYGEDMEEANLLQVGHSHSKPTFDNCLCTADYTPVCGTDGKTYSNVCRAKCVGVDVDYTGPCNLVASQSQCVCTKIYQPVCGTDGNTYSNDCTFNCQKGEGVKKISEGECPYNCKTRELWSEKKKAWCCKELGLGCPTTTPFTREPTRPPTNPPDDTCLCPAVANQPVCGSDGQTYNSACELNCKSGEGVYQVGDGPCKKCPKKSKWNSCASACLGTCADLLKEPPTFCTQQCVPDCVCNTGRVKNSKGQCVKPKNRRCRRDACNIEGQSSNGKELTQCGTRCEPTCANPFPICTTECVENVCQCPHGKVLRSDGKCVNFKNNKCQKEYENRED